MITVMLSDLYTVGAAIGWKPGRWYYVLMKRFCFLALAAAALAAATNAQLKQVNQVYILAMSGGMDQYLANQMTALGVFQVVTDPQKADTILTDRLGEAFEGKLKDLYPQSAPKPADGDAKGKDDKKNNEQPIVRVGGLSAGKGNFFLVDRKSRAVIWSYYDRPKDSTSRQLSRTAERVVKRLKDDLTDNKSKSE